MQNRRLRLVVSLTMIAIFVLLALCDKTHAQEKTVRGLSRSGQLFIWYDTHSGENSSANYTLQGQERYPASESAEWQRLLAILEKNRAFGKFAVSADRKTLTGTPDQRMEKGKDRFDFYPRTEAAIGTYFHGIMRKDSGLGELYFGPWEAYDSETEYSGWTAKIENIGKFTVRVREDKTGDGEKYLDVMLEEWTYYGADNIRLEFTVWLKNGRPVVRSLQWYRPGPCGRRYPSRRHPDIWNRRAGKYLPDLTAISAFAKYLHSGQVSKILAARARVRRRRR